MANKSLCSGPTGSSAIAGATTTPYSENACRHQDPPFMPGILNFIGPAPERSTKEAIEVSRCVPYLFLVALVAAPVAVPRQRSNLLTCYFRECTRAQDLGRPRRALPHIRRCGPYLTAAADDGFKLMPVPSSVPNLEAFFIRVLQPLVCQAHQ